MIKIPSELITSSQVREISKYKSLSGKCIESRL